MELQFVVDPEWTILLEKYLIVCLFLGQEYQDDTNSEGEGKTIQMTEDFYSNYRLFGKKKSQ